MKNRHKGVRKLDGSPHNGWRCCRYSRADNKTSVPIEFRGLSSMFGTVRKYGSGWIGQVILIGWKCSATLTVKLNYAPNKKRTVLSTTVVTRKCVVLVAVGERHESLQRRLPRNEVAGCLSKIACRCRHSKS